MKKQSAQPKKRGGRQVIEWTLVESRLLEQHYGTMLAVDLRQQYLPTRTVAAIMGRARSLGLTQKKQNDWTEEELALLRQHFGSAPLPALQKQYFPQRTYGAVTGICHKLGLRTQSGKPRQPWTRSEDTLLREHYGSMGIAILQQRYFPERSVDMLRRRLIKLGLHNSSSYYSWRESELVTLRREYALMGNACSQLLPGRTTVAVMKKARILGLERAEPIQWSEAELKILQREYPLHGWACVSLLPGRTRHAVIIKAHHLGVNFIRRPIAWREEELAILRREYPRQGSACVSLLPGRTKYGIGHKVKQLGLVAFAKQGKPVSLPE
ncbi:hypothetical protein HZU77_016025 [Neisseriaceae bacterium TC5R-5]|nr:hypothetical protein [Neisseriaceae bacterium TC5R-5]